MKKIIASLYLSVLSLLASTEMPTIFIGVYAPTNNLILNNLIKPNSNDKNLSNWSLSKYTEQLLQKKYKSELSENRLNLVLKDDFNKNLKKMISGKDIADKKIGFFHLNTFHTVDYITGGIERIYITFNLTFAQIGEESNRLNEDNNFEVRYTKGARLEGIVDISPKQDKSKKLKKFYKLYYEKAIGDLISSIEKDKKFKNVTSFTSNDIYFSLNKVKIGSESKELVKELFKTDEIAQEQILKILQENVIRNIRKDKNLDDVVLLYPGVLNKALFKNWKDYLSRLTSISSDLSKKENPDILIRKIKSICVDKAKTDRSLFVDGYLIETVLTEFYRKNTHKNDISSVQNIKSSLVSRISLQLQIDKKIEATTVFNQGKEEFKLVVSQESDGYEQINTFNQLRKDRLITILRKSIEKLSIDIVDLIKNIVIKRKKDLSFNYKNYCKE